MIGVADSTPHSPDLNFLCSKKKSCNCALTLGVRRTFKGSLFPVVLQKYHVATISRILFKRCLPKFSPLFCFSSFRPWPTWPWAFPPTPPVARESPIQLRWSNHLCPTRKSRSLSSLKVNSLRLHKKDMAAILCVARAFLMAWGFTHALSTNSV